MHNLQKRIECSVVQCEVFICRTNIDRLNTMLGRPVNDSML